MQLKKSDALLLAQLTISMLIKAREQKALECKKLPSITTTLISQSLTRLDKKNREGSKEKENALTKRVFKRLYQKRLPNITQTLHKLRETYQRPLLISPFPLLFLLRSRPAGHERNASINTPHPPSQLSLVLPRGVTNLPLTLKHTLNQHRHQQQKSHTSR